MQYDILFTVPVPYGTDNIFEKNTQIHVQYFKKSPDGTGTTRFKENGTLPVPVPYFTFATIVVPLFFLWS